MPAGELRRPADTVALHALAWLAFGNIVGLLLATLLLAPDLGRLLAPLSYGRWVPLHLDSQLYGWLGLPLVGLLLRLYVDHPRERRLAGVVVGIWSGTLLFGCVTWLAGSSSGKPFLEWSPAAAAVLAAGTGCLALLLLAAWIRRAAAWRAGGRSERWTIVASGGLLLALLPLPALLYRVSQPDLYPPFNPDSGGATGGSLLGSSLVVVLVFLVAPPMMRLERRRPRPGAAPLFTLLGLHLLWFALLDHGNRSHHEPLQILSLASLAVWPPLLWRYLGAYRWPRPARRWMAALGVWGGALVTTGVLTFLPGILEAEKFTDALVAHAHLAMAGMATSFSMLVLLGLARDGRMAGSLGRARPFASWQLGCGLQVVSLLLLGILESSDPGIVYRGEPTARFLYLVRWGGGLLMLSASIEWLLAAVRARLAEAAPATRRDWVAQ